LPIGQGKQQAYQTYASGGVLSGGSGRQKWTAGDADEGSLASIALCESIAFVESKRLAGLVRSDQGWPQSESGSGRVGSELEEAYETLTHQLSGSARERGADPFGMC
jgi:hypothetical protein